MLNAHINLFGDDLIENSCELHSVYLLPACRQMEFGVQAIFGPSDPVLGAHIQSICEALDVPHLEARIDFEPISKELSINLHPSQEHMNKAFKDVMAFLNWTKVAIIYEEDYGKTCNCLLNSIRLVSPAVKGWFKLVTGEDIELQL